MSKKYQDKFCAYCGVEDSITRDHVFPKGLFYGDEVVEFPMAPACESCNNEKSKLEHTLITLLPFGGRHKLAKSTLVSDKQKRRLKKNVRLTQKIKNALNKNSSKLYLSEEISKMEQFIKYAVKGLSVYYWGSYLTGDVKIEVHYLTKDKMKFFHENMEGANKININLGTGAISFAGFQGIDCPKITVWLFEIYGGLQLMDSRNPRHIISGIGVITETST